MRTQPDGGGTSQAISTTSIILLGHNTILLGHVAWARDTLVGESVFMGVNPIGNRQLEKLW